jgi:peroxiredoxin (alkyl hydroperoxide reductase subunit C)
MRRLSRSRRVAPATLLSRGSTLLSRGSTLLPAAPLLVVAAPLLLASTALLSASACRVDRSKEASTERAGNAEKPPAVQTVELRHVVDTPKAAADPARAAARPAATTGGTVAAVGRPAPDFTLPAYHQGKFTEVKLSTFRGKWVLLCFYPGDFTFV